MYHVYITHLHSSICIKWNMNDWHQVLRERRELLVALVQHSRAWKEIREHLDFQVVTDYLERGANQVWLLCLAVMCGSVETLSLLPIICTPLLTHLWKNKRPSLDNSAIVHITLNSACRSLFKLHYINGFTSVLSHDIKISTFSSTLTWTQTGEMSCNSLLQAIVLPIKPSHIFLLPVFGCWDCLVTLVLMIIYIRMPCSHPDATLKYSRINSSWWWPVIWLSNYIL